MNRLVLFLTSVVASAAVAVSSNNTSSLTKTSSSTARVITPRGCPAVTLTTKTIVQPSATYTATTTPTVTMTETPYAFVYTSTSTIYDTETVYRSTVTKSSTTTIVSPSFLPYKTTITVAAPPNFTPVSCQSEYYNPTVTSTSFFPGFVYTSYVMETASTTSTITSDDVVFKTRTVTKSRYTVFADVSVVTSTTTISRATRTKNPACASKNLVTRDTFGDPIYGAQVYFTKGNKPESTYDSVYASDAVNCCEICLARGNCTGSSFAETKNSNIPYNACYLFRNIEGKCDQKTVFGQLVVEQFPAGGLLATISNGLCGKTSFQTLEELGIF